MRHKCGKCGDKFVLSQDLAAHLKNCDGSDEFAGEKQKIDEDSNAAGVINDASGDFKSRSDEDPNKAANDASAVVENQRVIVSLRKVASHNNANKSDDAEDSDIEQSKRVNGIVHKVASRSVAKKCNGGENYSEPNKRVNDLRNDAVYAEPKFSSIHHPGKKSSVQKVDDALGGIDSVKTRSRKESPYGDRHWKRGVKKGKPNSLKTKV